MYLTLYTQSVIVCRRSPPSLLVLDIKKCMHLFLFFVRLSREIRVCMYVTICKHYHTLSNIAVNVHAFYVLYITKRRGGLYMYALARESRFMHDYRTAQLMIYSCETVERTSHAYTTITSRALHSACPCPCPCPWTCPCPCPCPCPWRRPCQRSGRPSAAASDQRGHHHQSRPTCETPS